MKPNIIKNTATKIIKITRENQRQQKDLNTLKDILIKPKYPTYPINESVKICLQLYNSNKNDKNNIHQTKKDKNKNTEHILSPPYVSGMKVLEKKLEKLSIILYFNCWKKLNCYLTSGIKLQSSAVVYQVECECG